MIIILAGRAGKKGGEGGGVKKQPPPTSGSAHAHWTTVATKNKNLCKAFTIHKQGPVDMWASRCVVNITVSTPHGSLDSSIGRDPRSQKEFIRFLKNNYFLRPANIANKCKPSLKNSFFLFVSQKTG